MRLVKPTFLHSKGNQKQNKKTALGMGKNICKCSNLQDINLQNMQTVHAAKYQTKQSKIIQSKNE